MYICFNCCQASLLLRKQLAELNKNPVEGFSAGLIDDDDIYRWEVCPQFIQSRDDSNFQFVLVPKILILSGAHHWPSRYLV